MCARRLYDIFLFAFHERENLFRIYDDAREKRRGKIVITLLWSWSSRMSSMSGMGITSFMRKCINIRLKLRFELNSILWVARGLCHNTELMWTEIKVNRSVRRNIQTTPHITKLGSIKWRIFITHVNHKASQRRKTIISHENHITKADTNLYLLFSALSHRSRLLRLCDMWWNEDDDNRKKLGEIKKRHYFKLFMRDCCLHNVHNISHQHVPQNNPSSCCRLEIIRRDQEVFPPRHTTLAPADESQWESFIDLKIS